MKIMVVMGDYPTQERERRRQAVLKCASAGTEIGFGVIKATFFVRANAQINAALPLVRWLQRLRKKPKRKATTRWFPSVPSMPALSLRETWSVFPSWALVSR